MPTRRGADVAARRELRAARHGARTPMIRRARHGGFSRLDDRPGEVRQVRQIDGGRKRRGGRKNRGANTFLLKVYPDSSPSIHQPCNANCVRHQVGEMRIACIITPCVVGNRYWYTHDGLSESFAHGGSRSANNIALQASTKFGPLVSYHTESTYVTTEFPPCHTEFPPCRAQNGRARAMDATDDDAEAGVCVAPLA